MVRSSLLAFLEDEDRAAQDFVVWLCDDVLKTSAFKSSFFRVFFDGSYRKTGIVSGGAVSVQFSDDKSADLMLLESASWLHASGQRAILVTSDKSMKMKAAAEGTKTMWCEEFLTMCRSFSGRSKR